MKTPPTKDEAPGAIGGLGEAAQQDTQQQHPTTPTPQAPRRPWREVLKVHPAAEMFPLMDADELRELANDIKTNGLTSGLVLCDDPSGEGPEILLDGRNRLDALELLGVELFDAKGRWLGPLLHAYVHRGCDPYNYVVAANIRRRHLTGEQKREIVTKLLKATPDKSNREIAKTVNVDDKTVGKVREDLERTAEIPQLTKTVGKDGKARPARQPKTIKATISKQEQPTKTIDVTTTRAEPKPVDVLAEFKRFVLRHLDPLPISERTAMARKWVAHINTAYLPERGEPIADTAKRVIQ